MKSLNWVYLILLLTCNGALADSWSAPKIQSTSSPNGNYILRVTPALNHGVDKASATIYLFDNENYEFYKSFKLDNDISPSSILITDNGTIFTFDNWGMVGLGNILSIYSHNGRKLKSYTLEALYSDEQVNQFHKSVSSIWWRDWTARPWTFRNTVCVKDSIGGSFTFNAENGSYSYSKEKVCQITL